MMGQADEDDDVTGKVVGAIAIGLGKSVGIRVCLLRHTESRTIARGSITALTRQGSSEGAESSGEDEVSHVRPTIAGTSDHFQVRSHFRHANSRDGNYVSPIYTSIHVVVKTALRLVGRQGRLFLPHTRRP